MTKIEFTEVELHYLGMAIELAAQEWAIENRPALEVLRPAYAVLQSLRRKLGIKTPRKARKHNAD